MSAKNAALATDPHQARHARYEWPAQTFYERGLCPYHDKHHGAPMLNRTRRPRVAAGIRAPATIDLVSRAQTGATRLIIAETEALSGGDVPALQKKIDSYVGYALAQTSSAPTGTPAGEVIIRVDLYAKPDAFVLEFLRQYRALLGRQGLGFELAIHQVDVSL